MKVLIIGGTGNISASVVPLLLDAGHEVVCLTRGNSGKPAEGALHMRGDRNDADWFVPTVRAAAFDAVIDFFAFTPEQGVVNLEAYRGIRRVIHVSTVTTLGEVFDWLPVTEDHPARPTTPYGEKKNELDQLYLRAHYNDGFPVTIIKPSTTYGRQRVIRQIGIDTRWITRIETRRPILVLGDGNAIHHLLHVDDAALAFGGVLRHENTIGQIYHLVNPSSTRWTEVHDTAMRILGQQVPKVGVPVETLFALDPDRFQMARRIFAHNLLFTAEKIRRDIPEFAPRITLENGLADAFDHLHRHGLVEEVPEGDWEDNIINAQRSAFIAAGRANHEPRIHH
ncbi:NAD-dependent epimerase/dehydratase family protein [Subtercola lobariae]|uniref:NAD-dependent epimerase/dehydratase domain-containing protein n=1 Tax=Subtercola lobariae TaxID=1588641 RepID=A0A917B3T5_9MICO|nr:NAD-dependent epimerase/dehydratase family protein [Subtercola lobariae]GGF18241.1 hypothetical protein GCM10011399_09930 [Subtercola lobariae]